MMADIWATASLASSTTPAPISWRAESVAARLRAIRSTIMDGSFYGAGLWQALDCRRASGVIISNLVTSLDRIAYVVPAAMAKPQSMR
jgi:hypothetical protein